jgi:hypothetical protein
MPQTTRIVLIRRRTGFFGIERMSKRIFLVVEGRVVVMAIEISAWPARRRKGFAPD